jgi:hypothetical protein
MASDNWPPVPIAIVMAAAVVGGVWALGWSMAKILPAIGVMVGLIAAISTTGLATAGAVASWTVPAASVGLTVAGGSALVLVLVKAAKEASAEPYEWAVPLLGILGGLMLDVAKDFGIQNDLVKAAVTAIIAFLVVVAGACWKSRRASWKMVAVVLLIAPPAALLVRNLDLSGSSGVSKAFREIPIGVWARLGGFLIMGVVIAVLHILIHRPDRTSSSYA